MKNKFLWVAICAVVLAAATATVTASKASKKPAVAVSADGWSEARSELAPVDEFQSVALLTLDPPKQGWRIDRFGKKNDQAWLLQATDDTVHVVVKDDEKWPNTSLRSVVCPDPFPLSKVEQRQGELRLTDTGGRLVFIKSILCLE